MKLPDSIPDVHTDKQAWRVAVEMGRLKNTKKQNEDLDSITIRKAYHKPQHVTLPQEKQQPRGQLKN